MFSVFVFVLLFFSQFFHATFDPDTQVHTLHGFVLMHDLQLGQPILSYNEQAQSIALSFAQDIRAHTATHAYKIICDDGISLVTTADQRIMLYGSHTWRTVQDLVIGDRLLCYENSFVAVSAIEPLVDKISLWHVTVAPQPTLLVTKRGIIVHNHPVAIFAVAPAVISALSKVAIAGVIGGALWSLFSKKKNRDKNHFIQESSPSGCSSPPPPKKPNDENEFRRKHPHGRYEDVGYHKNHQSGRKSPRPIDGQTALDNSFDIQGKERTRIGFSQGQFVVLNETVEGVYHGHVRVWDELRPVMQNILKDLGIVTKRGKFIK